MPMHQDPLLVCIFVHAQPLSLVMMTSSNSNIFRVTGLLWGESTGHRWIPLTKAVTRSFDVFFNLRLNKRLSKQSRRRWFETPWHSLWRHSIGPSPVSTMYWCALWWLPCIFQMPLIDVNSPPCHKETIYVMFSHSWQVMNPPWNSWNVLCTHFKFPHKLYWATEITLKALLRWWQIWNYF